MVRFAATADHYTTDKVIEIQGITTIKEPPPPYPVEVRSKLLQGVQQAYIVVCTECSLCLSSITPDASDKLDEDDMIAFYWASAITGSSIPGLETGGVAGKLYELVARGPNVSGFFSFRYQQTYSCKMAASELLGGSAAPFTYKHAIGCLNSTCPTIERNDHAQAPSLTKSLHFQLCSGSLVNIESLVLAMERPMNEAQTNRPTVPNITRAVLDAQRLFHEGKIADEELIRVGFEARASKECRGSIAGLYSLWQTIRTYQEKMAQLRQTAAELGIVLLED
ncbi:hypothetical protein PMZ80_009315 [Knufia obscura]|uniref:Uncharacterized protein n=1 Tax=Knufia obscura TaxID=1635080 RepID=A0ABR0RDM6_9EURO|nr:hypothetical protein PMZ80_009315 [Knufia obscura]